MSNDLKFEDAIEQLEQLLEELQSGNIPLDQAVEKYKHGTKLAKICQEKLSHAEQSIIELDKEIKNQSSSESNTSNYDSHEDETHDNTV